MRLYLKSVARDLLANLDDRIEKVILFNFDVGRVKINFKHAHGNKIGAQALTWIRIYLQDKSYYDFVTSSITYFLTKNELIIMANDDAEFVDASYIATLVKNRLATDKEIRSYTSQDAIKMFYQKSQQEMKQDLLTLEKNYSLQNQQNSFYLDLKNTFQHQKSELEKKYLLDLMIRQIINENQKAVFALL